MASYEQIGKKKLWSVRFREIGTDGREHNARLSGFRTKREAERAYLERTQMIERKRYAKESTVYDDVVAEYLRDREQDVKESVVYDLEHKIARHITPYFAGKDLARISERDIMDWRAALLQKGMTKAYLQNVNSRLGSILRFASARYRIDNPMLRLKGVRNTDPKREMRIWTPEQFSLAMQSVTNEGHRVLFRLLYATGCRKGEALALLVKDFDEVNKTINIYKSLTNKVKGKSWSITTPKNQSSYRKVSLPDNIAELLQTYIKENNRKPDDYIFSSDGSRPFAQSPIERSLKDATAEAQLPPIRIHDLRHSHASLLISSGVSIVAVAKRLGHADITQTLNTYSHCLPSDDEMILKTLKDI